MAEEERVSLSEKDDTQSNDTTQSKDAYVPEEPTPDTSICLSDIQMPETPESTKGQISDGDTSRLESPKTMKPVLGKIQAKKRLMAFANQFKVLSKSKIKSNSQHSTGTSKTKDKTMQDDTNKSRKKTEEKILAIEEIRREESKSKMLAMASVAAASMEDENHTSKNTSDLLESKRHAKERSRREGINDSRKSRSTINRKYSERHRHRNKTDRNSLNREVKDRNESTERSTQKSSQEREKRKKEKKRKDVKHRRDDSKADTSRDKKEEEKDRKESEKEKREETRERKEGTKNKKENIKDKRNDMLEIETEGKDKKEKDKDRWKEKELLKCNSWMELQKSGLTLDDISQLRRRDNTERSLRNRTSQDYTRYFEHMLMLNNYRVKRQALIAEGLDGPKKYPPESIKATKRAKGLQLLYCENPRMSLFLGISQLLQAVSPERRVYIRDICEASSSRFDTEDTAPQKRNWYQQISAIKYKKDRWQVTIQLPRSKWDSEDEETTSVSAAKKEIEKPINKLHISVTQQEERCSTSSSTIDEEKVDNNAEDTKGENEFSEKTIDNTTTNDEASKSPLLQSTGDEKLASEYEQFMKMVCTVPDVTKEYLPKKNPVKTASPHSYHEFNIESNLADDNTDIEISLKEKQDKLQTLEGSIKSTECEESIISTDCQIQMNENNIQIECTNSNEESEDSKSIPSDWENVRIKVERLSDENTESREIKKKKKQKKTISSSDSSSSTSSSDSEKEKKRKKRKRKILSNSSSSDSDSTDSSSSSSSDSSSSDEKRKKKRKKKIVGKKRKKARRAARTKKKRRRKMSTSSSSDSDERRKKKKKLKKKTKETKSINNEDINKIISKSPAMSVASSLDEVKVLHSGTLIKKIKEEDIVKDKKRTDQITSTRKSITGMSVHDNECMKQKGERKNKSDESFMEQWEVDCSMITLQSNDGDSSRDHTGELGKMDSSEKSTYRKKRKRSRDNVAQDKDRSSKINEERIHEGKERSDEELEVKRKKRKEKDVRSSTEFLADWEREGERINQQIIQNEVKFSKKLEKKQKKEKWGETDFDTLNVPSLTQLEKEVCQKQLLADEWEVDSLEAIPDLSVSKRKSSQNVPKKVEKEVRYDEKTDTYIAIEKESAKEMKKRQERLCAIRIWEEEQEEGEREEMMLLKQKNKHKKDDWDIEEESFLCKNDEKIEIHNDIVGIEKEWNKPNEDPSVKEDSNKLEIKFESIGSKRVRKSRWDMGSHSEEKSEIKDVWEEEYSEWSKINKCEQKHKEMEKVTYSESSAKSDVIDFYHKKSQNRESLERAWTAEELATSSVQTNKVEDASVKNLISVKTNEEQITTNQAGNQFKKIEILDLNAKFKEKTVELYSPSSPALSQKSQDIEASNDSSSSTSLPYKKRKKEMLIATEELTISTAGIPLQLTKLRDSKHAANEKIEDILDEVQLEDKSSAHKFDIKKTDKLFDDLSINELCPEAHNSQSVCMDIFAEYGSEGSRSKQHAISSATHTKDDETNAEKTTLKLIPSPLKQLLPRRTNEQVKSKRILETPLQDPAQHAAALLTIQQKLLESHVLENDIQKLPNEEPIDQFKSTYSAESNNKVDKLLDTTEFTVASKSSVIAMQQSPASEKAISVRSERSEKYDNRESKSDDVKKYKTSRNDINVSSGVRSPVREHRKKSPGKKENEKRYSHDYNRDKKERRSDEGEKFDRRDNKGFKADFADSRRKSSPSGQGKRKRSGSPYASWERQGSGSRSPGHSWSRSRSRSPKRKDEATTSRDRDKRRERYDDERSNRPRTDERRERYARSSPRSYNEDNFKKHGSTFSKGNRDDWSRRRYDSVDREKDVRSYDPMELLRERTMESEKYRDNRFHTEELDHTFWQYENSNILRDGNESVDSYAAGQDLPSNEYDDRTYYGEESLERNMIQCSPQPQSKYRRSQNRSSTRRDWQWEKDKDSISDLDRHGHRLRNRTPPRSRYSPIRQERFRRKSKSRSRSWSQSRSRTRSRSRSRSTSRSRLRMRSRSRSRSRSSSDLRSRTRSISTSRLRSPERGSRTSELRSSRSPSPGRSRLNEIGRERKDEDENRKLNVCGERGRRIETIVQSGTNILDSEMGNMDAANFQYLNEIEGGNEYYYTENNLTYPPCIDESTTSSPKRLSLDDRLELELGIKKQHSKDSTGMSSDYSSNFNPNVIAYPSPPQQQQQQMYRQQPTVLQVGNVLQVVPADFNGVQSSTRREVRPATCTTPPVRPGSSQVVRVGNVLQVVPTSLDWSGNQSTTADQSNGLLYSSTVPTPSPSTSSSVPMSVPVPVPVPLPVPPTGTNTHAPVAPATPLQLPLPIPVPIPVPIPSTTATAFPKNEVQSQSQKIVQPVYNYEAILETRRKEREERKKLRELRRKEKERKKIERINRRALRLLEKNNTSRQTGEVLLDRRKGSVVDPSVLKALKEGEEQAEIESPSQTNSVKEEEEEIAASIKEEDEDAAADEDEDDDEDEVEAEAEDDEEEEEEAEDEDEDDNDDDEKSSPMINQRIEVDETTIPADMNKDQAEIEIMKEWPELPPPPLKGILIAPGFRRDSIPNGNLDDLSDVDDDIKDNSDKDEETEKNDECNKDAGPDAKPGKSKSAKLRKTNRSKKSVQFADGIKPGEGTSPSGGEGDMPSPPPPKRMDLREGLKDLKRDKIYSSRKSRKQEKRARSPKTKKKVKVKIIKLKKPRVTPLTAMMMDDSDEMDDRSPPPPPPGSPPPPHLWPSYLSVYNTAVRTAEPQTTTSTLTSVQAPPPPTPLPLLVPPPPLNYTIQPCSKA